MLIRELRRIRLTSLVKTPLLALFLALLFAGTVTACGDDATGGNNNNVVNSDAGPDSDGSPPGDGQVQQDAAVDPPVAQLEIYVLDIWAQPLPQGEEHKKKRRRSLGNQPRANRAVGCPGST